MIGEPPSSSGAVHCTVKESSVVALSLIEADATGPGKNETVSVREAGVALDPTELTAFTVKVCEVPLVKPETS